MPDRKGRVLVVDDDARTARLLAKLLTDDGFDVEVSTDGANAIARLSRAPGPEVLVTDVRIPHADGLAVASYARVQDPSIAVFFVTGHPELVTRGLPLAETAHVFAKPLEYAALTAAMHRSLKTAA